MSDRDILRRIAERGLNLAVENDKKFIDIFQHLLDEIERLPIDNTINIKGQPYSEDEIKEIKAGLGIK